MNNYNVGDLFVSGQSIGYLAKSNGRQFTVKWMNEPHGEIEWTYTRRDMVSYLEHGLRRYPVTNRD